MIFFNELSGHLYNQTSMVCSSQQFGKREESQSGTEKAKRETFPMIRADYLAISPPCKISFSEMTDPGKERVEHCLALKVVDYIFWYDLFMNFDRLGHEIDKADIGDLNYSAGETFWAPAHNRTLGDLLFGNHPKEKSLLWCLFQASEREGDRGLLNGALNKDVNTATKQPALLPGQLLVGNYSLSSGEMR